MKNTKGWTPAKRRKQSERIKAFYRAKAKSVKMKAWHAANKAKGGVHPPTGKPYAGQAAPEAIEEVCGCGCDETYDKPETSSLAGMSANGMAQELCKRITPVLEQFFRDCHKDSLAAVIGAKDLVDALIKGNR